MENASCILFFKKVGSVIDGQDVEDTVVTESGLLFAGLCAGICTHTNTLSLLSSLGMGVPSFIKITWKE